MSLCQGFPFTAASVLEIRGNSRSGRDLIVIASHFREADWIMHFGIAKERNTGHGCRASWGIRRFGGTTEHLDCAFTTTTSGNTLENAGLGGVKGESNMIPARSIVNPPLRSLRIIPSSLLIFEIERLAHLDYISTCTIVCLFTDFEGDILEEAAFGVKRVFTYGGEL